MSAPPLELTFQMACMEVLVRLSTISTPPVPPVAMTAVWASTETVPAVARLGKAPNDPA